MTQTYKLYIFLLLFRKGCDDEFLNQLFAFSPKKITYVSCDPATQV